MANSRSVQQSSNPQASMWSPESVFPENPTGVSKPTRAKNGGELDPKGVLQAAAQWAAGVTGAHGAAVAVGDTSGMCCCASFGNAPDIGANISGGLSAICLRTSKLVQCDDTETDPRVDAVACRELELRSVLILPVLVDSSLRALIEVFSSKPHAFDARQRQDLTRMADSLAVLLADADSKPAANVGSATAEKPAHPSTEGEGAANVASEKATPVLKTSAAAVVPKLRIVRTAAQVRTDAKAMATSAELLPPLSVPPRRSFSSASKVGIVAVSVLLLLAVASYLIRRDHTSALNADLGISQEKTAQPSAGPEITFNESALSVIAPQEEGPAQGTGQTSQLTPGKLIRRVEPTYPTSARDSGTGGSVVLTAIVSRTGAVENVKSVRGPEPLSEAAAEAVRQWVYEPYRRNGEPVAVQTTIVVNFTPPKR